MHFRVLPSEIGAVKKIINAVLSQKQVVSLENSVATCKLYIHCLPQFLILKSPCIKTHFNLVGVNYSVTKVRKGAYQMVMELRMQP